MTQRCSGETKITLNAGTSAASAGWAVARWMRSFDTSGENWQKEIDRLFNHVPEVTHSSVAMNLVSFLDDNQKFAGVGRRRAGYGLLPRRKRFMTPQRVLVCEAGAVLEAKYGKSGLMLTGTIEGSGDEIAKTVAEYSGYIFKRLRQWFRDTLKSEQGVLGVWEWQQRGMLHFHLAVMSLDIDGLDVIRTNFKNYWASVKEDISRKSGVNLFKKNGSVTHNPRGIKSQQDAQWIRKSIGRYFSKYTSKEARAVANKGVYCPSRWVTVDRKTSAEAKRLRVKIVLEGFCIAGWKNVFSQLTCAIECVADAVEYFVNPYLKCLPGVVFWEDVSKQPLFHAIVDFQVTAAQNAGVGLILH